MLKDELKEKEYTGWFVHKKDHRTKDELHGNLPKITDNLKIKPGGGGGYSREFWVGVCREGP